jgi:hypothetical protein
MTMRPEPEPEHEQWQSCRKLASPPTSPPAPPPPTDGGYSDETAARRRMIPLVLPRAARSVRKLTRRSLRTEKRERARSLFLLDYDNTLLPTNMLRVCRCLTASGEVVKASPSSEMLRADLDALDAKVCSLVLAIQQLPEAEVVIVTNASEGWVQTSSAKFMPKLRRLIAEHNISVRHTRKASETGAGGSPEEWKAAVFKQELAPLRWPVSLWAPHDAVDGAGAQAVRIISIGDSMWEHNAAAAVANHDDIVVTVKLLNNPTARQLYQQLQTVRSSLPKLHAMSRSVSINTVAQKKNKKPHQAAGRLAPVVEHPEEAANSRTEDELSPRRMRSESS